MPSIKEIEFTGNLIAYSHRCTLAGVDVGTHGTDIEFPEIAGEI